MSKVYVCQGKSAQTPWYVSALGIRLYSVEELCWFLKENAHLLDEKMFSDRLAEWVEKECGMPQLAAHIRLSLKKGDNCAKLVKLILEEVGYCEPAQIRQAEKLILASENMSLYEKQKARGDLYLDSRKYVMALQTYRNLLHEEPQMPLAFKGKINHNMGVALARMYFFEQAAACFETAWELNRNEQSLIMHLICLRIIRKDAEYLNYVTSKSEYYNASLQVEKLMTQRKSAWTDSRNDSVIASIRGAFFMEDLEQCDSLMAEERKRLEEEYRKYVAEN